LYIRFACRSPWYDGWRNIPTTLITAFDYDLRMPGFGRLQPFSKLRMIVIVLLFVLVFVLVRLGLLR